MIRRLRHECGQALPMALAIMTIFGILTAAITINGAANDRSSLKSADARQAFALAQSALAYGEGAVYSASGTSPPTTLQTIPSQPGGGTGTYQITQVSGSCNCTWSISATGTVDSVSRTITAIATDASTTTVNDYSVWNYLYADSTSACTTISGGVTVSVPILTRGSVCISGGASFRGSQLKVGGTLSATGGNNIVGTSTTPVGTVQIGSCTAWNTDGTCKTTTSTGCTVQPNSVVTVAVGTNPCDGKHNPLYATSIGGSLDVTPQMPCIGQASTLDPTCPSTTASWSTLVNAYNAQKALTKTGCPANLFDNDTTLNNSDTSITTAMFGSTAYDCKVGTNEIKYTPSGGSCGTGTLFVSGTLYFDGSLSMGCGLKVVYTGQATMYFTGTVTEAGGTQLCGIASCTASWNPATNGIIFIAGCWTNSTGSTLASSKCVYITGGSTAQWGAYATTAYQIDGGSSNMGPVLANSMVIGGGSSTLIPFTVMPPGTPLNTDSHYVPASPPTSWSG